MYLVYVLACMWRRMAGSLYNEFYFQVLVHYFPVRAEDIYYLWFIYL